VPRTWVTAGLGCFGIGLLTAGPKTLWNPQIAAMGGRWEVMAVCCAAAILFFAAALARYFEASHPSLTAGILATATRFSEPKALGLSLFGWAATWAIYHGLTDPDWVSSGIDWHDAHLDAYALLYGDPPLYCAWRYPFYPMVSATVSHWTGMDLQHATQFVSRGVAMATAVPLFVIGRSLFGRSAAIAGVILLTGLASYRMHTDAVTPYPMVMFLAACGAAGLMKASQGGWRPWLVVGLSVAAALANDGKSLLLSLGFVGLALPMALVVQAKTPWLKLARIALVLGPIIGSYQWMSSLPVKAFTLEEMAVAYLVPGGRGENQAPRNLQTGYMWGHFDDALTIPRTLATFYEAGKNPELAKQNARQLRTSLQRLNLDYPGISWRLPGFMCLALLIPLLRRRGRFKTAMKLAAVAVVIVSCWPSIKSDYQERYVVHGLTMLPLLLMGGVGIMAKAIVGSATPLRRLTRGAAVIFCAVLLLIWPSNPVGLGHLSERLDPVAMGGTQEHEIGVWGREHLSQGDIMLDTSWMMQGLLLSGSHTIARAENAYPPGGAPWPAGSWRFTRPWPEERPTTGRYFALVNYLAMAPNTFDATHAPIEALITGPDSDMGKSIAAAPALWTEVFRTSDTIVRVYQYQGKGPPRGWQTHRRPM